MIKRVQLNSRKSKIDVFKRFPQLDLAKVYALKIEYLTIPPINTGLILNKPLFSIERRGMLGEQPCDDEFVTEDEYLIDGGEFIPTNVKNTTDLVYQINVFFRRFFAKLRSGRIPALPQGGAHIGIYPQENTHAEHPIVPANWHDLLSPFVAQNIRNIVESFQCCIYDSGKIGFRMSAQAQLFLVIKLTDEGMRIFGSDVHYLAPTVNGDFNYVDEATQNVIGDRYLGAQTYERRLNNSIFVHEEYRNEIVINTTLPVPPYIECNGTHAKVRQQLVSYRYPKDTLNIEYVDIMHKTLSYQRKELLFFEQNSRTHNSFIMTGTELQNFHLHLMLRKYEFQSQSNDFVITETDYPVNDDSMWTMMLSVVEIK